MNPLRTVGGTAIFRLSRAPKPACVVPASRVVSSPVLIVPKSLGLYSASYLVQALCLAGPRGYLSNALPVTVGSE